MNKISVIILTKNEEQNIERALKSVQFCDEIIVVDDESNDNTVNKIQITNNKPACRQARCQINDKIQIYKHKTENDFAAQRNWAMEKANNEWVLFLDADEEISLKLKDEMVKTIELDNKNAYLLKRTDYFWRKELKYGETKKAREKGIIRLLRKGTGKWVGAVHEEFIPNNIEMVGRLEGYINHFPHQTLSEFISDINRYSDTRALELYNQQKRTNIFQILIFPFGKFFLNYIVKLGCLDGPSGFVYAFLMSFHSFLVRTKLFQIQNTNNNRL